ncbi:MAG: hypothetical protein ACYCXB_02575 [Candidatus Humimicrobiaceae bacterium]
MKKLIILFIIMLMDGVIFVGCKTTLAKSEPASVITNTAIATAAETNTTDTTSPATPTAETMTAVTETTTKVNEAVSAGLAITISGINNKDVNFTNAYVNKKIMILS